MTEIDIKERILQFEASRWVGVKEQGGDNRGQLVEMFQKAVDGKAEGEPWCLAFCFFCIDAVDLIFDHIYQASFPHSDLFRTEGVLNLWGNTQPERKSVLPRPGNLVLWQHFKNGNPTGAGHAEIVTEIRADGWIRCIGGNTTNKTDIDREGDCVADQFRNPNSIGSMRLLGYVSPWKSSPS